MNNRQAEPNFELYPVTDGFKPVGPNQWQAHHAHIKQLRREESIQNAQRRQERIEAKKAEQEKAIADLRREVLEERYLKAGGTKIGFELRYEEIEAEHLQRVLDGKEPAITLGTRKMNAFNSRPKVQIRF